MVKAQGELDLQATEEQASKKKASAGIGKSQTVTFAVKGRLATLRNERRGSAKPGLPRMKTR